MSQLDCNYFVAAATIAAKLDFATKVAHKLALTASNARALTLRAGQSAAGFRPLTDAIHRLSDITVSSSKRINFIAAGLSKMAVEKYRADSAIKYFEAVYLRSADSPYLSSIDDAYGRTKDKQSILVEKYQQQIQHLKQELEDIEGELRSAVVLKTLCQVEASQAGALYQDALNNVADNVETITSEIKDQIIFSRQQVGVLL